MHEINHFVLPGFVGLINLTTAGDIRIVNLITVSFPSLLLQEAFSAGVPVLVLPFTNDQGANAVHVEYHGLGVQLDPRAISSREVTDSLITITSPKYRSAVKKIQRIHAEAGGSEKAADLVEFYEEVGYEHLIPAYAKYKWSWVQYYSVDVYATLLCILLGCICIVSGLCFCVCRRIASFVHIRKVKSD